MDAKSFEPEERAYIKLQEHLRQLDLRVQALEKSK